MTRYCVSIFYPTVMIFRNPNEMIYEFLHVASIKPYEADSYRPSRRSQLECSDYVLGVAAAANPDNDISLAEEIV